ncbi:MAG TPA: sulfotransferase domain-containing protein [Acidimicrobiia bacterium]|nr:sulfotransferase domain-containing protein [Acidimicrobiia bacterium]
MEPLAPLPTFLIIGAQKSATRWLRLNLGLHPDVFAARTELEFFNNGNQFRDGGTAWYREQFEGWNGESIVGEATPGYMFWRHRPAVVAERIEQTVPDVRLLATLRNPIDRAQSAMVHHIELGSLPADSTLVDVVKQTPPDRDRLGIIAGGWYAASLEPYRERFGDHLLILVHDDIDDDPRGAYDAALVHVGAEPDFVPPELERVRFSYQQEPSSEPGRRPLTLEQRREIWEYFADDVAKLEKMLARDLSLWEP